MFYYMVVKYLHPLYLQKIRRHLNSLKQPNTFTAFLSNRNYQLTILGEYYSVLFFCFFLFVFFIFCTELAATVICLHQAVYCLIKYLLLQF